MHDRDIAQPGLARLSGGQKVASSNLAIPTIFLPRFRKIVSNLHKKASSGFDKNALSRRCFFFFILYFLHWQNMRSLTSLWGVAFAFAQALRRFAPRRISLSRPFFCLDSKAKKHEAVRIRFMHRRCASYILMLDEQSSQAQNVLHTFVCLTPEACKTQSAS